MSQSTGTYNGLPVMDAQIAEDLGQDPKVDDDFYTFNKSAMRTEAVVQPPQGDVTLEGQFAAGTAVTKKEEP